MRKNCTLALAAFLAGRSARPADSIWSNGDHLYSYATCIVARGAAGEFIVNRTRYSTTTSIHQGPLTARLRECGRVVEVRGLPRGCDARDLREAASATSTK